MLDLFPAHLAIVGGACLVLLLVARVRLARLLEQGVT
jgi:hypothetical protein